MPDPVQLTRAERDALTAVRITDAFNKQNSAADLREVLRADRYAAYSVADDGQAGGGSGAASFATIAGLPGQNAPLAAALRKLSAPNTRPDSSKRVRFLTRAEANTGFGGAVFEEIDRNTCHLGTEIEVEFYQPAGQPRTMNVVLVAIYDAQGTEQVFRDGSYEAGQTVPARWVKRGSPETFAPAYASKDPAYAWATGEFMRSYAGGNVENFFKRKSPGGAAADATSALGDANWELVSGADLLPPEKDIAETITHAALLAEFETNGVLRRKLFNIIERPTKPNESETTVIVTGVANPTCWGAAGFGTIEEDTWKRYDLVTDTFYENGPTATLDPYDVPESAMDAVRHSSNTWVFGDLIAYGSPALQAAGAPPAVANQSPSILVGTAAVRSGNSFDRFEWDGTTESATDAYRYEYRRRNTGSSGWTRIAKLQ